MRRRLTIDSRSRRRSVEFKVDIVTEGDDIKDEDEVEADGAVLKGLGRDASRRVARSA